LSGSCDDEIIAQTIIEHAGMGQGIGQKGSRRARADDGYGRVSRR